MSLPVAPADVERRIAEYGERALLITVGGDGRPHVVSVVVAVADGRIITRVGSRTAVNIVERPGLTLTWPAPAGSDYVLILDGSGQVRGGHRPGEPADVAVGVERGILHRVAGSSSAQSCVTL